MEDYQIQGSESWKAHRRKHVTATDANVIMGHGFRRTIYDIWLDKLGMGKEVEVNEKMARGTFLEPYAREWVESETGISYTPTVRNSQKVNFMMASSDGWNAENNALIEIKTSDRLHDSIPEYYRPQLAHLMAVFDVKEMLYVSYDGTSGRIIEVKRDDAYIENLIEQEKQFWYHVQNFIEPELSERDYVKRNDPEYQEKLLIYLQNKHNAKMWDELAEKAKAELTAITTENTSCMGCKISKRLRIGNVDYKQLTNDIGIDADTIQKYRKSPVSFWQITEGK